MGEGQVRGRGRAWPVLLRTLGAVHGRVTHWVPQPRGAAGTAHLPWPCTQVKQLVPIITCQVGSCGPWTLDQGRWLRARPGCGQLGHRSGPAGAWGRGEPLGSPGCWRAQLRRRPGSSEGHPVRVLLPTCCTTWGRPPGRACFPTGQAGTRTLQGPLREGSTFTCAVPSCSCSWRKPRASQKTTMFPGPDPPPPTQSQTRSCLRGQRGDSPSCPGRSHLQAPARPLPRLLATLPRHREASAGRVLTVRKSRVEQGEGPGDTPPVALRDAA